jgi:hypothetical protein
MTVFKVGDRVCYRPQPLYYKDAARRAPVFEVEATNEAGTLFLAVGDETSGPYRYSYSYELVEPAPDVAKLQEELNQAAFAWLQKQDNRQHDMTAALRYFEADGDGRVLDAARALQAALQPPEPVYLVMFPTEFLNKALTVDHIRRIKDSYAPIEALYLFDGTRFGEPITGDELAALLAGES